MKQLLIFSTLLCTLLCFNHILANNSKELISEIKVNTECPSPIINSFTPTNGPVNTLVTIFGSNFNDAVTVSFDGVSTSFTIVNDNEITAYSIHGLDNTSTITITSSGGCTGNSSSEFTSILSTCTNDQDIYISELYDAETGSPGFIELYNPTNSTIVFGGIYELQRYRDIGDPTPTATLILPNSIGPLQTYLVKIGSPNACGLTEDADMGAGINDNDEIKLLKNGTLIDVVNAPNNRGYTVIRNADAVAPSNIFNTSEWLINSNESCTDLGSHTANPISITIPIITQPNWQYICENGNASYTISIATGTYTYQWKVLNSSGVWENVVNNAIYSGANTNTLTLNNVPISFDNNQYYCEMTSATCDLVSDATHLFVTNPDVDTIANQTVCTDYTLPALTVGTYFTGTNGTGTQLNAGDVISTTQTIYIYNETGTAPNICSNESS
ncbi:IPT/TIG domain-containing protein, partial [Xanthomarina sp. F2636L]|uniref:IPT/TIG domain-containing protein n=1 Tax=Xanthomarina sp. F2636L TaxID=2996018 RepID=UPI00225E0F42